MNLVNHVTLMLHAPLLSASVKLFTPRHIGLYGVPHSDLPVYLAVCLAVHMAAAAAVPVAFTLFNLIGHHCFACHSVCTWKAAVRCQNWLNPPSTPQAVRACQQEIEITQEIIQTRRVV